jgi:UDP-N-acetylglucosamine 2-epimerase (non-hydrolysing)
MKARKDNKIKVLNIVGARPNFMKIAPIHRLMQLSKKIEPILLHTGQHYDRKMSKVFFDDLEMPEPQIYLGIGSGSHAEQTGKIMIELEKVMLELQPDLILVVGDVNSTLAASLVASKLHIPVAHVEAGLRSFDRAMPEEINRVVTDSVAEMLFVTEESGEQNLLSEGVSKDKIFFVGNVMIDSLLNFQKKARNSKILHQLNLEHRSFALVTLHRPSNVDSPEAMAKILKAFEKIEKKIKIIFPIHPRTKKMIEQLDLGERINLNENFTMVDPLGYLDFLCLMENAAFLLTDSGGIQEETTVLGIPCITMRENTERPITVDLGTNVIVGMNTEKIIRESFKILSGKFKTGQIPPLWDGKAAQRIVKIIESRFLTQ